MHELRRDELWSAYTQALFFLPNRPAEAEADRTSTSETADPQSSAKKGRKKKPRSRGATLK